jgi:hypothetical protein
VIPWACVHRMLYCSAVQSSVDEFRSQDFGLKLNWEAPMGSNLVYSILSPEWNADKTRVDKVRYWTAVARLFHKSICAGRSLWRRLDLEEAGSGHEDSSHNILRWMPCMSRSQVSLSEAQCCSQIVLRVALMGT